MDFYEAVAARRTIRDFENVSIDDEVIERIISAGMAAPTNDHMRDWHFILIRDKTVARELLKKIPKEITDEEMDNLLRDWSLDDACQQQCYKTAVPKQYRMLADASCILIPLLKQKTDIMKPENLSHLNGFASIWCCIENIFLAATAEEYACTLRIPLGDEAEWARSVLSFPEDYLMPCFIGIGKPSADAVYVRQKPFSAAERIHRERW